MYPIQTPYTVMPALPGATPRFAEPPQPSDGWVKALEILKRRWKLLVAVVVAVLALVTLATLMTPKQYTAQIKLIAGSPAGAANGASAQTNLPVLNALLAANGAQTSETYAELLRETPVAEAVVKRLHLNDSPSGLLSHISVRPVTNTNILVLNSTWRDPKTAAAVANAYGAEFVDRERVLVTREANGAIDFIAQKLPEAQSNLRKAETALARYESAHNIVDINAQTNSAVIALAGVDAKINQTQLDRDQATAQIASLSAQLAGMSASTPGTTSVEPNPVLPQLKTQLAQVDVQLHNALHDYTESHPTVIALREQQRNLRNEIAHQPATVVAKRESTANPVYQQLSQQLAASRAAAASANAQLAQLQTQRASLAPSMTSLPQTQARLAELQRRQKLALDVYTALQQKYNDAMVAKSTSLSDVTIVEPALASAVSVKPNIKLNLELGALLALLVAGASIYVIELFDTSIKDQSEVERELSLPVLANIPQLPTGEQASVPAVRYAVVESFLQLVTALRYSSDKALRTVAITSPMKGDGKSTIAMNTALALGELAVINLDPLPEGHLGREPRVLLIDADLRRPSLHRKMNLPNHAGLSDVLIGNAKLIDVVQKTQFPGLDVLSSGTMSPNPIKLLQSERFDAVLEEASRWYTTVILDAPAMLPVFDAAILSIKADGTILVVSAGSTDLGSTKRALQRLESVGVREFIGIVVNRSTERMDDYDDYFEFARGDAEPRQLPNTLAG